MAEAPKQNYRAASQKGTDDKAPEEKPAKPKLEPIEGVQAVEKKRGVFSRVKENFTGEDAHSVFQYVAFEVFIPQAKTIIADMVSQGIERALFGDVRPRSSSVRAGYTNYNRASTSTVQKPDPREPRTRERRPSDNFGEIVVMDRGHATEILERLMDNIEKYDVTSVVDLYDLVGMSGSFLDNKWGWTDLRGAGIRRVRDGYLVDLPRPVPID